MIIRQVYALTYAAIGEPRKSFTAYYMAQTQPVSLMNGILPSHRPFFLNAEIISHRMSENESCTTDLLSRNSLTEFGVLLYLLLK